jgi:TATA-binding protein-associated factor Taf7
MLPLSTEYCVIRAHQQRVDVVAIRKIESVEDDRLETDVRSASGGLDAIDRHEVLRGPSVGTVRILA